MPRESAANLNTNALTHTATSLLLTLDAGFVGTDDYMGLAYFWAYEYRYSLRDMSYAQRRRTHRALLAAGLPVDGESDAHAAIIARVNSTETRPA